MRLIDADELLKREIEANRMGTMLVVGKGHILDAPTIDATRYGNWIDMGFEYKCNQCDEFVFEDSYYCPNCGSKMK